MAFLSIVPAAASAQFVGTTSGRQSAFSRFADTFNIAVSGGTVVGSVTLAKGKKKRNLVVDVTTNYFNVSELTHPVFSAEVNGIVVPPLNYVFTCPVTDVCLNSMTWWVDLDALELANPGQIIAQPLNIEVRISAEAPIPTTASGVTVQTGARLQPK